MLQNLKVSIIVPVYNAEKYIKETITSVIQQTYQNWELILVDDMSSDLSCKIIEGFLSDERIHLLKLEKNSKAAAARNAGIKEATGDVIAFVDADDIWKENKLEKQLEFMRENDCAFSFTAYEFADENAVGTGKYVRVPHTLSFKQALSRTIIFTSTVMLDMRKLNKDEIMMPQVPSEDTATWWKILKTGKCAYGLNEVLTIYRRPAKSLSSNKFTAIKRIWFLLRKQAGLGVLKSAYYFVFWAVFATARRL